MKRNRVKLLVALATALVVFAGAEVSLRSLGHRPWRYLRVRPNEPTIHEHDARLGWRNRAGVHVLPAWDPASGDVTITFFRGGRRRSAESPPAPVDDRPKIVLVGGSFTQGWAIGDDETYAWRMQSELPAYEVLNFGTGGYGTYQALLTLEDVLPRTPNAPIVVYGFIEGHEQRNVAPGTWLAHLSKYSNRGHVDVPFVTMDADGALRRHAAERHPTWPLREQLATVALAEKKYMELRTRARTSQARSVTEKTLHEMREFCASQGATLVVVVFKAEDAAKLHYTELCERSGTPVIDCAWPLTKETRVPKDGHPNGIMNARWAEHIVAGLRERGLVE